MKDPKCCDKTMERVYHIKQSGNTTSRWLKGWFCKTCKHFEPAIGREHQL